ncbi:MAG: cytochrome c oxidase accessory protein CcoG [Pseudomonadota bacterium]
MSTTHRVIPLVPVTTRAGGPGIEPAVKIQARHVSGRYARWRWVFVWLTQALFYGLPWLNWHGRQAVLFDLDARRFYLFDAVLFPQDLIHLTGLLVFSALLLFAATAVAGRVWCGFACPQTVYTELFMWIEQRSEGDRLARLRLDAAPWSIHKLLRRGSKHASWVALSLLTGFSLVGWFTPVRSLANALPALAYGPWEIFWILFYAAATYLHAGVLREKVCQHACPYARFQGAMLDARSLVVGYDLARGEPRSARARGDQARSDARSKGLGDCVDCTLCVQVCPVGIDIRHGLQAACISCGLCIDACNNVMDKLGAPRGLVRFGAMQTAEQARRAGADGWRHAVARPRVLVYGVSLLLLAAAMGWGWAQRPQLRVNAMRDRGVLARQVDDGAVENVYRLQVMNASLQPRQLRLQALAGDAADTTALQVQHRGTLAVDAAGATTLVVTVRMRAEQAQRHSRSRPVPIRLVVDDLAAGVQAQTATTFLPG